MPSTELALSTLLDLDTDLGANQPGIVGARLDIEQDAELLEHDVERAILVLDGNRHLPADDEVRLPAADTG